MAVVGHVSQRDLDPHVSQLGTDNRVRDEGADLPPRLHQPFYDRPTLRRVGADHNHRHTPNLMSGGS